MSNINPIKFGVTDNRYFKPVQDEKKEQKQTGNDKGEAKKQVDSKEVLGFMAAQNIDLVPKKAVKTVDVTKYVTTEQAARIGEFMHGFEKDYDNAYTAVTAEFPNLDENTAGEIALAMLNSEL